MHDESGWVASTISWKLSGCFAELGRSADEGILRGPDWLETTPIGVAQAVTGFALGIARLAPRPLSLPQTSLTTANVVGNSLPTHLDLIMQLFSCPSGATLSYERGGKGAPLVLVHGSFSDHDTNWAQVRPALEEIFTVFAIARRGRGQTTSGPTLLDEAEDLAG